MKKKCFSEVIDHGDGKYTLFGRMPLDTPQDMANHFRTAVSQTEFFRAAGLPRDLLPPAGSYLANAFVAHGGAGETHMSLDEYRAYAPGGKKRNRSKRKSKKKQAPRRGLLRSLWHWVRRSTKRFR